jgi:hypothetical protein
MINLNKIGIKWMNLIADLVWKFGFFYSKKIYNAQEFESK